MTIEQACHVLNREQHNGVANYSVKPAMFGPDEWYVEGGPDFLTEFETIAIAEKYERLRVERGIAELARPFT